MWVDVVVTARPNRKPYLKNIGRMVCRMINSENVIVQ